MKQSYLRILFGRLVLVGLLVFLTYNPLGFSFYHWVASSESGLGEIGGAFQLLIGVVILVCYIILFRAAWRAYRILGIVIMIALVGAIVYLGAVAGYIDLKNPTAGTVIVELTVILILAVGSTWSIAWRRGFGQVSVEDPDTGDNN